MSELTCYRRNCRGAFTPSDDPDVLFRCGECGSQLNREGTEQLAEMEGALPELASELLDRATEKND